MKSISIISFFLLLGLFCFAAEKTKPEKGSNVVSSKYELYSKIMMGQNLLLNLKDGDLSRKIKEELKCNIRNVNENRQNDLYADLAKIAKIYENNFPILASTSNNHTKFNFKNNGNGNGCACDIMQCTGCGVLYFTEGGWADYGIKPGTCFDDIIDFWTCPICGAAKSEWIPYQCDFD